MRENDNAIFMEPEEYKTYLAERAPLSGEADTVEVWQMSEVNESCEDTNESHEDISLVHMTLYEMNQQLIANMPCFEDKDWDEAAVVIADWVNAHMDNYYMLLCKELSYYTLFNTSRENITIADFTTELFDILKDLGAVKNIEVDTNGMIAIWLNWHGEETPRCFYLFPYGAGVVHV